MPHSKEQYSFTKLSTFHQCKLQYYLQYILHQRGLNNAFSEYGTICHSILERYAKGELAIYELLGEYEKLFPTISHDFPYNKYVDLCESYYNGGYNFFKHWEGLENYEILGVEDEFIIEEDDFRFKGFIDLILKDKKGRIILHDWKSKSKFKSKHELKEKARQLYLYSTRIKERFGVYPDILQFGLFRVGKTQTIPFNLEAYNEAREWMFNTVKEIRECNLWNENVDKFFCESLCNFREDCILKN